MVLRDLKACTIRSYWLWFWLNRLSNWIESWCNVTSCWIAVSSCFHAAPATFALTLCPTWFDWVLQEKGKMNTCLSPRLWCSTMWRHHAPTVLLLLLAMVLYDVKAPLQWLEIYTSTQLACLAPVPSTLPNCVEVRTKSSTTPLQHSRNTPAIRS